VKARLQEPDAHGGFILDGFPRTVAQADALGVALEELGKSIDAVVSVEVDMPLLLDRLTARRTCRGCGGIFNVISQPEAASGVCPQCGGELYQRDDDTIETVSNRLAVYERNTAPLIEYYRERGLLRPVDGNQPVDDVFAAIQTVLEA